MRFLLRGIVLCNPMKGKDVHLFNDGINERAAAFDDAKRGRESGWTSAQDQDSLAPLSLSH
jgi:hypothetical protein